MPDSGGLGFGGLWYAVLLYLVLFFVVLHLVDRLAHRKPPEENEA
ncbi:MAG: hypothetical protein ACYS0E_11035 [Planctomycetota bacterium]|jgi:hypothetical protein